VSPRLLLDPEPQAVRHARLYVAERLEQLGREDLLDSAELGVSELVTNAILHADPPITVRVRGTPQHPRVEVHDNSQQPPRLTSGMSDDDRLMRTFGRGLGIVALYSTTWGAEVSPDGKVVWFEPSLEPDVEEPPEGDVYVLDDVLDERMARLEPPERLVTVRLLGMPVALFAQFRGWYAEIRRELRILGLVHGNEYPVTSEMVELTLRVEQDRRLASGIERLDAAIAAGQQRVDLEYHVPPGAPETMHEMVEMLDRADRFCREHLLLTTAATEQLRRLWHWYGTEFSRQAGGEEPVPWPGSYTVDEPSPT
jgi:anti-sigma regulatory factor (Ser/Thr protein kinase)